MDNDNDPSFLDLFDGVGSLNFNDDNGNFCLAASKYVSDIEFDNDLKSFRGISILSSNICSLNAKFDNFSIYLEFIKSQSVLPTIICFSETWLSSDDDVSIFNISDYTLFTQGKTASSRGGLATYVHNSLKSNIVYSELDEELCEGLFIEITDTYGKNFIISDVYRPPRYHSQVIISFIENFQWRINKLGKFARELVMVGDYNIDLLKVYCNHLYANYLETKCSLSLLPRNTHPTRFSASLHILIDNAFCRLSCDLSEVYAGILSHTFSDHHPYVVIIPLFCRHKHKKQSHVFTRKMTDSGFINFKSNFINTDVSK